MTIEEIKKIFQKNIIIIFFLGLASGIPLALIFSTLKVFLVDRDIDIVKIGFISLISIPYSIKFLWAPLIDSVKLPYLYKKLGKRRSWIFLTQSILFALTISLGILSQQGSLSVIITIALLIAITSATHDIAVDAYRIETIKTDNQAFAASFYIYGYRIGMLISGSLALILSDIISWDMVYYMVAITVLIGILTTIKADEKKLIGETRKFIIKRWLIRAILLPLKDFLSRPKWYIIVLFILCFKLTDAFAGNLFLPFLLEMDFSKTEIATIVKTFGMFATLFGAFIGGVLFKKLGVNKCLWVAILAQIISNIGFYYLSLIGNDIKSLYLVIFIENLSGGIGDVVFIAYLSSLCNIRFTATQYSLLVSIASASRAFLSSPAGIFANMFGWSNFFLLSIILGIPSLILLIILNQNKNDKNLAITPNSK